MYPNLVPMAFPLERLLIAVHPRVGGNRGRPRETWAGGGLYKGRGGRWVLPLGVRLLPLRQNCLEETSQYGPVLPEENDDQ